MAVRRATEREIVMVKAVENFVFGLTFGMGFCLAQAVLALLANLLSRGAHV